MKRVLFMAVCGLSLVLSSCGSQQAKNTENASVSTPGAEKQQTVKSIPYVEADNYFFRNDATIPSNPKINTKEEFDALFGMARVMGDDGIPTPIDFNRQFVIAVVHPVTKGGVELDDERLLDDGQTLTFEYSVDQEDIERSFEIQPILLVIVDRKYERKNVVLKEVADY
ncbi:MAG: hypothetical protein K6A41_08225 [Bacteroidales bacterium]|nr:hypothetical protein [Bacteroidales bacterium]